MRTRRKQKGGKLLGSGSFGAVFGHPPLECYYDKKGDDTIITKLMTASDAEKEGEVLDFLEKVDPTQTFLLYPLEVPCRVKDHLTKDIQNYIEKKSIQEITRIGAMTEFTTDTKEFAIDLILYIHRHRSLSYIDSKVDAVLTRLIGNIGAYKRIKEYYNKDKRDQIAEHASIEKKLLEKFYLRKKIVKYRYGGLDIYNVSDNKYQGSFSDTIGRGEVDRILTVKNFIERFLIIMKGVDKMHKGVDGKRIFHCDIKPDNMVMRIEGGQLLIRLVDFGLVHIFGLPYKESNNQPTFIMLPHKDRLNHEYVYYPFFTHYLYKNNNYKRMIKSYYSKLTWYGYLQSVPDGIFYDDRNEEILDENFVKKQIEYIQSTYIAVGDDHASDIHNDNGLKIQMLIWTDMYGLGFTLAQSLQLIFGKAQRIVFNDVIKDLMKLDVRDKRTLDECILKCESILKGLA